MLPGFVSKHAVGIVGSQAGNRLARLVRAFLVFKVLSGDDANRFMWLASVALVGSVFSDFGLRNTVYAELGRLESGARARYLAKTFGWKIYASVVVLIAVPLWVRFSGADSWTAAVLTAVMSVHVYVADPGVQVLRGAALGHVEFVIFLVDSVIPLGCMVVLWITRTGNLEAVLAVWACSGVIRTLITWGVVQRRLGPFRFRGPFRDTVRFAAGRAPAGFVLLLFLVHLRFPVLVAPYAGLEGRVGVIALCIMVVQAFQIVPVIVSNVVVPAAFARRKDTPISSLVRPSVLVSLAGGFLAAFALLLLAEPVMRLGRPEFVSDAGLLRIATVALPFICGNQMLRLLAIAGGASRRLFACLTGFLLIEAVAITLLSVVYGATGTLYGYVGSEVLLFVVLTLLVRGRGLT